MHEFFEERKSDNKRPDKNAHDNEEKHKAPKKPPQKEEKKDPKQALTALGYNFAEMMQPEDDEPETGSHPVGKLVVAGGDGTAAEGKKEQLMTDDKPDGQDDPAKAVKLSKKNPDGEARKEPAGKKSKKK